ncbi:DNA adenine methylase [Thermonema rossianum]|uniref:DNA adenine methylase n=1 Tax=Thermonema rossianum TaxID=55505 RepID=UPI00056EA378|nr:DNA adenine methylase [Thermonema rossianum]
MQQAKPFIKWVGGKSQLLPQLEKYLPKELHQGEIKRYIEPFVGGGALFFATVQRFKISSAYLSDLNADLILTYQVVQQQAERLIERLDFYQKTYDSQTEAQRKALFLEVRKKFNEQRHLISTGDIKSDKQVERAAQFIFLNKTCYNGLFRLNAKGEFNVPFGKYKRPAICNPALILRASECLQLAEIRHADYKACRSWVNDASLVYFDPPYRPLSPTANFTTYTGHEFTDEQQKELAAFFRDLACRTKAKLMLSNSDPKNMDPDDHFFEQLYAGFHLFRVAAGRAINSKGSKRGKISELLITNYAYEPRSLEPHF